MISALRRLGHLLAPWPQQCPDRAARSESTNVGENRRVTNAKLKHGKSDGIVFRVLAQFDRSEAGLSLQELLDSLGLSRALDHQYTKRFREENHARGFEDKLSDLGLK